MAELYPDYATGGPDGPALWDDPAFLKAQEIWMQETGREPATDGDFAEISHIMEQQTGQSPTGDPRAETDPMEAPTYSDGGAGPGVRRAAHQFVDRYREPDPMVDRHKLRITGAEDDMPFTDDFDYSGDIDAEPRVDEQYDPMMEALIAEQGQQMTREPLTDQQIQMTGQPQDMAQMMDPRMMAPPQQMDRNPMQSMQDPDVLMGLSNPAGNIMPGPLDAMMAQMQGPQGPAQAGLPAANMAGTVTAGPPVPEAQNPPGTPGPDIIQMIMKMLGQK